MCPIREALRTALLAFNSSTTPRRPGTANGCGVILETEALQAYSMTMYAGWRAVVAEFVARRLGVKPADLVPQTVAWTMLGVALAAYETLAGRRDRCRCPPRWARVGVAFDTVGLEGRPLARRVCTSTRRQCGASAHARRQKFLDSGVGVRAATATIRV